MRYIDADTRKALLTQQGYFPRIVITLLSGETLELTESDIMVNGISNENAVSPDNSFSALGSTIISGLDITINNIDNTYNQYTFEGADVQFFIYIPDGSLYMGMGCYTVDTVIETDYTIRLSLLDYMINFERPYSESKLEYPATLYQIVRDACDVCGVNFSSATAFRNRQYTIQTRPDDKNLTFRDVIGWVASMGAYFARMSPGYRGHPPFSGTLSFEWFDIDAFNSMGRWYNNKYRLNQENIGTVTYDNVTYQYGTNYQYIDVLYSKNINVNKIKITGVKVVVNSAGGEEYAYISGSNAYTIELRNNKFITEENAQYFADYIAPYVIGLTFYIITVKHTSNFMMQPGDAAVIYDSRKNQYYPILITRTVFSFANSQTTVCGATSISKNQVV